MHIIKIFTEDICVLINIVYCLFDIKIILFKKFWIFKLL